MEIKVQKKSRPWWLLLLLALLSAGLLWFLITRLGNDENRTAADGDAAAGALAEGPGAGPLDSSALRDPVPPEGPSAANGGGQPITSLAALAAGEPRTLVGREVRLGEAPVPEMIGDATFWIGDRAQRVLVVLDQQIPSPPAYVEGRVNVNAGQSVSVQGVVRSTNDLPAGDVLDAGDRAALAGQPIYIWARTVQVVSPAEFAPAGPPGRTPN